ncbi:hypothetical protein [Dyella sp. C11]|uniref:hypothetical protein n=1 Tax=Dyella sp. C11 TaxID=2126991 RepID=UPI000D6533DC|nr:hypothetical protein [Dyella sp. C11]
MSTPPIQTGRQVTEEEKFYLDWGRESLKANLQLANNVLQQLLTLSTSLAAGGVLFLSKETVPAWLIAPVLLMFMLALVASLWGIFPYGGVINLSSPAQIQAHKTRALRHKRRFITIAFALLMVGLLMAGYGVCAHAIHAQASKPEATRSWPPL